jgi:hypothetical protein
MERNLAEERKIVEALLSEYAIKERLDIYEFNALVATLLNGEKRLIEFEKTIVPSEVVGRYFLNESLLPIQGLYLPKHYTLPIGIYDNYSQARQAFDREADDLIEETILEGDVKKISLIGEFKGQILDVDPGGIPDVNTGIILGSASIAKNGPIEKLYADIALPVQVSNKVYVEFKAEMRRLKFEGRLFPSSSVNAEFWKIDAAGDISHKQHKGGGKDDGDDLLHKRNAADWTTEQWVAADQLLSKRSGGNVHGKGMH